MSSLAPLMLSIVLILLSGTASEGKPQPAAGAAASAAVDVGLDPGHSRFDVGAAGGGLKEYEVTLAVAERVRDRLKAQGFTVTMSRTNHEPLTDFSAKDPDDRTRIEQEARIAAAGDARVYVSLHFNGHGNPDIRGTETYYNRGNHGAESLALAKRIQARVVGSIRSTGYSVPDRGVKEDLAAGKPYGHFFSLRGPMPSVLVESLFLSNPGEAQLLRDESFRDALASGLAAGIAEHLKGYADSGTSDQ